MLSKVIDNTFCCSLNNKNMLREVTVKIGLKRINTQEGVIVEALLDSSVMGLVMSSEFARKQEFKLKRIEQPIYIRNIYGTFNKKGPIKHMIEVNIYYQGHRKRMDIDVIRGQKQNVILEILWLTYHNSEIDWRIREVKMIKCSKECGKQQRPKQGKLGQQKQKEEEKKKETEKKQEEKEQKKEKKIPKKKRKIEIQKIAEEQEIWDKEVEVVKSETEAKKLVPERFHKQIYVFGKKASEQMSIRKLWDHVIDTKEEFVPRKEKVCLLLREEKKEVYKFILEQLKKGYIRSSKLPQTALVFFVRKKDEKKRIVQNYRYLNEQTIKNNYLLPLISDIAENIDTKKVFTKMNLQWEYNNVRIKEGDK